MLIGCEKGYLVAYAIAITDFSSLPLILTNFFKILKVCLPSGAASLVPY